MAIIGLAAACTANPPWLDVDCDPVSICDQDGCDLTIDLEVAEVSGTITWDGAPLPESEGPSGTLLFVHHDSQEWARQQLVRGPQRWFAELPSGTYDVQFRLDPRNAPVDRPHDGWLLLAEAVDVGPGTTLDLDAAVVSLSGAVTVPPEAGETYVTWQSASGRGGAHAKVVDGRYALFVPPGPGALLVRGRDPSGREVYAGSPAAVLDASADTTTDLTFEIIEVNGTLSSDAPPGAAPTTLWFARADEPSSRVPVTLEDGAFSVLTTPGEFDLGAWFGADERSFAFVDRGVAIDEAVTLDLSLPVHRVSLREDAQPTAAQLQLTSLDDLSGAYSVPRDGQPTEVWVGPGRYRVEGAPLSDAPGWVVLAEDLDVQDDVQLPGFPPSVTIRGSWEEDLPTGWTASREAGLTMVPSTGGRPVPQTVMPGEANYELQAMTGTYAPWVYMDVVDANGLGFAVSQKVAPIGELAVDSRIDVQWRWVEVDQGLLLNGEPTSDPSWDGRLWLSHHEQPTLQTPLAVVRGQQPRTAVPPGVYDLTYASTAVQSVQVSRCVLIE